MKRITLYILLTFVFLGFVYSGANNRRLIIKMKDNSEKVFDTAELKNMSFDSVSPVQIKVELVKAGGYTLELNVTKPEECRGYKVAVAKKSENVADWYSYLLDHSEKKYEESGAVMIGNLNEETDYVVGVLATDRYDIASSITLLDASTTKASESEKPKIGYLLFEDGTWAQRAQNGKKAIGLIFSTTPSEKDKAKGFTHGYALALYNAAEKVKWTEAMSPNQTGEYTSSVDYGFQTDKDGLSHTSYLLEQNPNLFPAAKAAVDYSEPCPAGSSGWYLPSSGQWYDICVNLGGLSAEMPRGGKSEGYWNGLNDCNTSLATINSYMSLAGQNNYDPIKVASGDYLWFWTSSESSESQAYVIFFDNDQLVVEIAGYFKNYDFSSNRVRSVIAF